VGRGEIPKTGSVLAVGKYKNVLTAAEYQNPQFIGSKSRPM